MSLEMTNHTVTGFDADLQELNRMIAEMGRQAERQIREVSEALLRCDCDRANGVVIDDAILDSYQRAIEEKAIATIAIRQPMAIDLREIVAILRIAGELERIGDLAKNIGKRIAVLDGENVPESARHGVLRMAAAATNLLKDVLDSYAERDCGKAVKVWNSDEQIDASYASLFQEMMMCMPQDSATIVPAVHLLFCGKNLERVGDHATNIAEMVHYIVTGHVPEGGRPKVDSTSVGPPRTPAASSRARTRPTCR